MNLIFVGNLGAGDTYGSRRIFGNFNRRWKATALAVQNGADVQGYLFGKYKRGWVVIEKAV